MGAYGALWGRMGAYGGLWGPLGTSGDLWRPLGTYGGLWGPMGAYGDLKPVRTPVAILGSLGVCIYVPASRHWLISYSPIHLN